ncbi:MAG: ParB/RepB/Spo0J family partition protein [Candidatus Aenigmatarchaeota archaeon]
MKTERISVNLIDENEYNPNEMDENHYKKLVQNIKRKGFRKPIEVRKNGERYTIVDGAHRFRACKELGYTEVDCIVDEIDVTEAMVDTLNANIHGSHNPYKEAMMFKQIHDRYTLQDIEKLTAYGQTEIKDRMDLLGLPANVQKMIEELQEKERKEAPVVLTFIVKETERQLVMDALGLFEDASDKNKALLALCKSALEKQVISDGAK